MLNAFTDLTLLGMQKIAVLTHLAKPAGSLDNTLFVITHHGQTFALSVVSACSGVNGVVGFLLVGSAFAAIVRGPIVRKVLWLSGGMALLWAINLGRITFIFFAGKEWGEGVAINVFHPFIGLVTFSSGRAGDDPADQAARACTSTSARPGPSGTSLGAGPFRCPSLLGQPAGPIREQGGPGGAEGLSGAGGGGRAPPWSSASATSDCGRTTWWPTSAARPSWHAFIQGPVAPPGWNVHYETSYGWAKPLFGDTSVWNRYMLHAVGPGPLHTNVPVVADVINTPDLSSFSAYGVENCYAFHGYALADVAQVSLVGGVTGPGHVLYLAAVRELVDRVLDRARQDGNRNHYERVVLYVQNSGQGAVVKGLTTADSFRNLGGNLNRGKPIRPGPRSTIGPSLWPSPSRSSTGRRQRAPVRRSRPAPSVRDEFQMPPSYVHLKFA